MTRVGLTGNVAAGKSTVVRVWQALGAVVIDADLLARRAVEPGTDAHERIVSTWGSSILDARGGIDRPALRQIVFADPRERAHLEAIVHPAVAALRETEFALAVESGANPVVFDIPLLFETGMADEFDVVVLVDALEELRLARLVEERGLDPEEARRIIASQMPAELKRARADVVIENSGSLEALQRRSREVWSDLVAGTRSVEGGANG